MRLSELLNRPVVNQAGEQLGHVHDVRGELETRRLRVSGLIAGGLGVLERYGIGTDGKDGPEKTKVHDHPFIPWERVVRIGPEIVVSDE
jgi:sporulation protein YlmC with PRC-barrel domain